MLFPERQSADSISRRSFDSCSRPPLSHLFFIIASRFSRVMYSDMSSVAKWGIGLGSANGIEDKGSMGVLRPRDGRFPKDPFSLVGDMPLLDRVYDAAADEPPVSTSRMNACKSLTQEDFVGAGRLTGYVALGGNPVRTLADRKAGRNAGLCGTTCNQLSSRRQLTKPSTCSSSFPT